MKYAAVLAFGLPENSRVKLKAEQTEYPIDTMLLTVIADSLRTLMWLQTKDGTEGTNRPEPLFCLLFGDSENETSCENQSFESVSEFEKARAKIIGEN